jgi:hypothetical protein
LAPWKGADVHDKIGYDISHHFHQDYKKPVRDIPSVPKYLILLTGIRILTPKIWGPFWWTLGLKHVETCTYWHVGHWSKW